MNFRKHLYYITVSDIQHVAEETVGRSLSEEELNQVSDKILERIQWYDPVEETILAVTTPRISRDKIRS